jgi:NADPH:quinone reductase-like Zn-dependent oxidoreductase
LTWSAGAILLVLFVWFQIAYWRSTNDCASYSVTHVTPTKALRYCEYGTPDVAKLAYVEKPVPTDNQVLVKVRAASLNAFDTYVIRDWWAGRFAFGLRKPKDTRLGRDVAGVVEAVGKNIADFKPGDEVFGTVAGSLAEYAVTTGRGLIIKPQSVSFEDAASVPVAGMTALQGLREGNVQPGQKVLINGATGGVGTIAVQIAKSLGAEVTAVCSTRNIDLVRSIGADHVIDYTKQDFTKGGQRYDVIFENVRNHSFAALRGVLTAKGICALAGIGGSGVRPGEALGRIIRTFAARGFSSFTDTKFAVYYTATSRQDLTVLGELLQDGELKPVIERTYSLEEAPQALRQLHAGHARGKLVVTMQSP